MTFNVDILTLVAVLGTFQGLVFSLVFWIKNKTFSNKLFSLFLFATSFRIAKNILVHLDMLNPELFPNTSIWRTMVYFGLSHQFAIGPLLLLYFQSKLKPKYEWSARQLLHFVPYVILMVISPFITWNFWKWGGLWASYVSILVYFLLSLVVFYQYRYQADRGTNRWLGWLLLIIAMLLIAYSPKLFQYIGYVGGATLYAIAVLGTGYVMLVDKGTISFFRTKYESSALNKDQVAKIKKDLQQLMLNDQPYLDAELTLQSLAKLLGIHPHHLSRVVNQQFKMNFADYINSFRLKEATKRLTDPAHAHLKISALAFDCGFNSVPTFNTLFKKVHKVTPSEFRKQQP